VVVALNDDVAASADDVQLSLELDGRRQPVEMTTRLNSRALTFTAPSKRARANQLHQFIARLVFFQHVTGDVSHVNELLC